MILLSHGFDYFFQPLHFIWQAVFQIIFQKNIRRIIIQTRCSVAVEKQGKTAVLDLK